MGLVQSDGDLVGGGAEFLIEPAICPDPHVLLCDPQLGELQQKKMFNLYSALSSKYI